MHRRLRGLIAAASSVLLVLGLGVVTGVMGAAPAAADPTGTAGVFHPMPSRLIDTHTGTGGVSGPLVANTLQSFQVTPPPPVGITVGVTSQTATGFRVNWSEVPGSTGYQVTRSAPAPGETPWTGTDPASARGRDILWLRPGFTYSVEVKALPSGAKATVTVPVTGIAPKPPVVAPPVTPPIGGNKYGFMVFLGNAGVDKDIAGIVAAGGGWARLGMYDSGSFTTAGVFQPNVTTWATFKYACQKAKSAGLKVMWDAADTLRIPDTLTNAQWITWQSSMWRYMAQQLGPCVDAWQVFNEHDVRDIRTFAPVNNGYPMNQARIQQWFRFHDVVSAQMDFIGLHAYPEFNGSILTSFVQRTYDRYKKPVAVLEFGVSDSGGYGTPPQYLRVGDGIVIQNDALLAVKDKLLCATLYSLRNRVQGGTGEGGFGILDNNWTRKAYWQKVVDSIAKWS